MAKKKLLQVGRGEGGKGALNMLQDPPTLIDRCSQQHQPNPANYFVKNTVDPP